MGLFRKRVPKKLIKRILDSIVEGNTYLVVPSYIFLVRTRGTLHLKFDRYFRRSFFYESCIYGRHRLVELGMTESPLRGQIITQDLVDTAFLITCAQHKPSIDVLRVLLHNGGADINARWNGNYYLKGSKDVDRSSRKKKKRSNYFKKYLSRYTSGRVLRLDDTPLILACRKRPVDRGRSRENTSHLMKVIQFLKENGASQLLENSLGHDAMTVAIDTSFFRILFEQHEWLDPNLERLLKFLHARKSHKNVDNNSYLLLLTYGFETTCFVRDLKKRCSAFITEWQKTLDKREHPEAVLLSTLKLKQMKTPEDNGDDDGNGDGDGDGGSSKNENETKIETKEETNVETNIEIPIEEEWESPDVKEERIKMYKRQQRKDRKKRMKSIHLTSKYVIESKDPTAFLHLKPDVQELRLNDGLKHWKGSSNTMNGDTCRITQNEIIPFLSFLLLDAAQRGIMPNNHFTEQFDGSLAKTLRNMGDLSIVCAFLRERCVPLLSIYIRHDIFRFPYLLKRDCGDASIGWGEMLPLIQSLYCLIWRASKPEHPGSDEFVSAELDRDIVKARSNNKEHYYLKLKKIHTTDTIAPLPVGWSFVQDVTGGYYSNTSSRKTSLERPTNIGRSFA